MPFIQMRGASLVSTKYMPALRPQRGAPAEAERALGVVVGDLGPHRRVADAHA